MSQSAGFDRYTFVRDKTTYACLECQTTTRSGTWGHLQKAHAGTTCPKCRQPMTNLGPKERVPKKRDRKGWARLRSIFTPDPAV